MAEKEKEKKSDAVEMIEVPVEMGIAYRLPDGTIAKSGEELLLWISNTLWEIKKSVA